MDKTKPVTSKIINAYKIDGDYPAGYSDDDIILLTNAKFLADPDPVRLRMNTVVLCTQGKAQMELNGRMTLLDMGQLLICPPNTSLTNVMLSPDYEFKGIFVSDRMLQSFLHEKMSIWTATFYLHKTHTITIDEEDLHLLSHFYDMIYLFLNSKKERRYKAEMLQSSLRAVFLGLCELCAEMNEEKGETDGQESHGATNVIFQQFLRLLGSTSAKHRTVEWYASELCISAKHLSAVCKNCSGKTANEWIREHVLEDIRYYLKSTDLSIKQVSTQLGFANTSFFGKYVKEHFGMTPLMLRMS